MTSSHDSSKTICVSKDAEFPTTCISCGMYADAFVTVKSTETKRVLVKQKASTDPAMGLGCLLFFLGPIGLLISLVMKLTNKPSGSETMESKNVNVKQKVKVPQCRLCQSQGKLSPISVENGLFEFEAHSNFISSYRIINRE